MQSVPYDAAGHRRSPVTMPGFHEGRAPRNKGRRYPPDPPAVKEIIAVMREGGSGADGARLRALIVILWRAGLRIGEALDLAETDLDASRGAVLVRRGKGGRRRDVGMDRWAWSQLEAWMAIRRQLPVGALLCVIRGATAGRRWEPSSARKQLARTAARAGVRRRFAPHQLRHAHAVEMAHEGVPLVVIQRQLGHVHLGVTSIHLQGIDSSEIIDTVHSRPRAGDPSCRRAHSKALSPNRVARRNGPASHPALCGRSSLRRNVRDRVEQVSRQLCWVRP
jgi:integrase